MSNLSLDEIRTIITSLEYSIQRIQEYPHQDYQIKRTSLKPVEDVLEKVRLIRDTIKEQNRYGK
jgi:hypothetical protein